MTRARALVLATAALLSGCGTQPRVADEVLAGVVQVYSAQDLAQPFHKAERDRFAAAGFGTNDFEQGRLLRVACGLGSDYTWGSYAWLPEGMHVKRNDVVRLRVDEPTRDDRMALNPVLSVVPGAWGSASAYRFIPDWRERKLSRNIERIPLPPGQEGRYVISHSSYVIKCRPPG